MKNLKKITPILNFLLMLSVFYQCSGPKETIAFQEQTQFKIKKVYFQEWYAGIDIGGTGVNIFVPIANKPKSIQIDSVFFKNLKGKLIEEGGRYSAVLKNKSRAYTFDPNKNPSQYPFELRNDECVVSYIENGETKYVKIQRPIEFAGTYYENGAPTNYIRPRSKSFATLDADEDN